MAKKAVPDILQCGAAHGTKQAGNGEGHIAATATFEGEQAANQAGEAGNNHLTDDGDPTPFVLFVIFIQDVPHQTAPCREQADNDPSQDKAIAITQKEHVVYLSCRPSMTLTAADASQGGDLAC